MNEIQIFSNNNFGKMRTIEENGKTWFCGSDVSKVLGYTNPQKAMLDHCKEDGVTFRSVIDNLGREQKAKFISEGNVFRLITHSKLPKAEEFESWVFDTVLPTIRKTGGYGNTNKGVDIELISKIVAMTVKETLSAIGKDATDNQKTVESESQRYNRKRGGKSKVEQLPSYLRITVDEMLEKGETYRNISEFCNNNGFNISMSAVGRYEKSTLKAFNRRNIIENNAPHKVLTFPQEIKTAVDFMICNKVTHRKIAEYCCENGYDISSQSIWRYQQIYFPYI